MKIGVRLPNTFASAGEFLADCQALEAAGADLLVFGDGDHDPLILAAAAAATTTRVRLTAPGEGRALATLEELARGRLLRDVEGWEDVDFPAGREAWAATLQEAEEAGREGLIVAHDPRLLDLLRNPDTKTDRSDLQLAQG